MPKQSKAEARRSLQACSRKMKKLFVNGHISVKTMEGFERMVAINVKKLK